MKGSSLTSPFRKASSLGKRKSIRLISVDDIPRWLSIVHFTCICLLHRMHCNHYVSIKKKHFRHCTNVTLRHNKAHQATNGEKEPVTDSRTDIRPLRPTLRLLLLTKRVREHLSKLVAIFYLQHLRPMPIQITHNAFLSISRNFYYYMPASVHQYCNKLFILFEDSANVRFMARYCQLNCQRGNNYVTEAYDFPTK